MACRVHKGIKSGTHNRMERGSPDVTHETASHSLSSSAAYRSSFLEITVRRPFNPATRWEGPMNFNDRGYPISYRTNPFETSGLRHVGNTEIFGNEIRFFILDSRAIFQKSGEYFCNGCHGFVPIRWHLSVFPSRTEALFVSVTTPS